MNEFYEYIMSERILREIISKYINEIDKKIHNKKNLDKNIENFNKIKNSDGEGDD